MISNINVQPRCCAPIYIMHYCSNKAGCLIASPLVTYLHVYNGADRLSFNLLCMALLRYFIVAHRIAPYRISNCSHASPYFCQVQLLLGVSHHRRRVHYVGVSMRRSSLMLSKHKLVSDTVPSPSRSDDSVKH